MGDYNVSMGTTNFKIEEINVSYEDIFNNTKRLICSYSYYELYDKIINDSYFSGMFYTFLKSNKTYILDEVIDFYYETHMNALYENSMKALVKFLVEARTHQIFRAGLVNFFKDDCLIEFLKVLFITKDILDEKFKEVKLILEDEKEILDKKTYETILKEEFFNSLLGV